MIVVKSIVLICLAKYGYNASNPIHYQLNDYKVSACVDIVTKCYYTKNRDVFECLKEVKD